MNFHSIFHFLPFPVKHMARTKCCKVCYHCAIISANTLSASINRHLFASSTLSEDLFFCFFMFLVLIQRHRPCSSFSSQYFSRSCRSFLVFSWRFKFPCFRFETCCWNISTVELTSPNWYLYFCIFWNFQKLFQWAN